MCTKYRARSGDVFLAIQKEGGYPITIFNGDLVVDVEKAEHLRRALDAAESGIPEDWDPVFVVNHYENKNPSGQANTRP